MWNSYHYRTCNGNGWDHYQGLCRYPEDRSWDYPWDRIWPCKIWFWLRYLRCFNCNWWAVCWYCSWRWQGIRGKAGWWKAHDWGRVRRDRCWWPGYDVRFCKQWDRRIYALSYFYGSQAGKTPYRSKKERYLKVPSSRWKDPGYCRIWWEWQASTSGCSCSFYPAWWECIPGADPWGY